METPIYYKCHFPMNRRMVMNEYITEKIGNEYQEWKKGDVVFLKASTGAGKTHFILHTLLAYAAGKYQYILYLVNRKILKMQLEAEISELPVEQQEYINVELYQSLEAAIRNGKNENIWKQLGYAYIICDEAHYFSSDSLFNTGTELGYRWIQNQCCGVVKIYISATLDFLVENRIKNDEKNKKYIRSKYYKFPSRFLDKNGIGKGNQWEYLGNVDYSYLEYHVISNIYDILEEICKDKEKEKWLIFVDSLDKGKKLLKEVEKKLKVQKKGEASEVLFISADYKEKIEGVNEVSNIAKDKKQLTRILICTSVMDNGISLKDFALRNLVIETDAKDEFLQMLGRKRDTGEKTKLYLVNKPAIEIERRLYEIRKIKNVCVDCLKYLIPIKDEFGCRVDDINSLEKLDDDEKKVVYWQHCWALQALLEKNEVVQKIFYAYEGILRLNFFSIERIEYLDTFYTKLLSEMEKDEFALIKKQLSWLGKSSGEIDKIVEYEKKTQYEKSWEKVNTYFENIVGINMGEKEFIDIKMILKDDLEILVREKESFDYDGATVILNNLPRNDRVLSKKNINWLRTYCDLKYEEEQEGEEAKIYRIVKAE